MSRHVFTQALLDPSHPPPSGLKTHHGGPVTGRFAIYRNNVMVSLIEALSQRFSVVQALVGEEFFAAMAGVFVRAHPPRSPLMMTYGEEFPAFIDTFEPAASLPYLADVARLEAARTKAYHAADAEPLGAEAFAALPPEALGQVRVVLHPSLQLLRSSHPIVSLWAMHQVGKPHAIETWAGEDALVIRPAGEVEVRRLAPGQHAFFASLCAEETLGTSLGMASADSPDFSVAEALAALIGWGAAISLKGP